MTLARSERDRIWPADVPITVVLLSASDCELPRVCTCTGSFGSILISGFHAASCSKIPSMTSLCRDNVSFKGLALWRCQNVHTSIVRAFSAMFRVALKLNQVQARRKPGRSCLVTNGSSGCVGRPHQLVTSKASNHVLCYSKEKYSSLLCRLPHPLTVESPQFLVCQLMQGPWQ